MKPTIYMSEENKVVVYGWKSGWSAGAAGHISLRTFGTGGRYISWWPNMQDTTTYRNPTVNALRQYLESRGHSNTEGLDTLLANAPAFQDRTFDADCWGEGNQQYSKKPDYEIVFYSLDKNKIHAAFDAIKQTARWHILGNTSYHLAFADMTFHSCSSMTAYLLTQGGGICGGVDRYFFGPANFYERCKMSKVVDVLSGRAVTPEDVALIANEYEAREKQYYNLLPGAPASNTGNVLGYNS